MGTKYWSGVCKVNAMVSLINIINGIKEPTREYHQNCDTSQILMYGA